MLLVVVDWSFEMVVFLWNLVVEVVFGWSVVDVFGWYGLFIVLELEWVEIKVLWVDLLECKGGYWYYN